MVPRNNKRNKRTERNKKIKQKNRKTENKEANRKRKKRVQNYWITSRDIQSRHSLITAAANANNSSRVFYLLSGDDTRRAVIGYNICRSNGLRSAYVAHHQVKQKASKSVQAHNSRWFETQPPCSGTLFREHFIMRVHGFFWVFCAFSPMSLLKRQGVSHYSSSINIPWKCTSSM